MAAKKAANKVSQRTAPKTMTKTKTATEVAAKVPAKAAPSASARKSRERFLLEITSLPTAAGREDRVIAAIEAWVAARKDRLVLSRDRFGNLTIARHDFLEACARGTKSGMKPVMITAHLDHPAFVVTAVRAKGTFVELDLEFRGGVNDPYFKGAALEVFDRDTRKSFDAKIVSLDAKVDPATKPFKTVVARLAKPAAAKHITEGSIARWKFAKA